MSYETAWADWFRDWQTVFDPRSAGIDELLKLNRTPFLVQARASQRPPQGAWRTWLYLGGRGAGKTRAGAEWARFAALFGGARRIALIGPTLGDVREVMIEGPSGLKAVSQLAGEPVPRHEVSRHRLVWPNGAQGFVFSAEDPDSLRGPQFDAAWCDEIAHWPRGEAVWDMLQFGLRLGDEPRAVATTTPKPVALVRRLVADPSTQVKRGTTFENSGNLAPGFLAEVERLYAGTRLGEQELMGALLEAEEGAVWTRDMLKAACDARPPDGFEDIVVAVDPPAGAGARSDACGIIAAGRTGAGAGRLCHVLADATVQGLKPLDWGRCVVRAAHAVDARQIIAEANQGGEMVRHTLDAAGCDRPVRLVHARLGKRERASPVAALYDKGAVRHAGRFDALETELCAFGTDAQDGSPDRVDALVWAVWALMIERSGQPRLRGL